MIGRPRRSTLFPYPTLSGSHDGARRFRLAGEPRIGRDQVVGLEARLFQARNVEGFDRLADQRKLRDEIGRHVGPVRSEEHTSELQSPCNLVCRLLLGTKTRPSCTATTDGCTRARSQASHTQAPPPYSRCSSRSQTAADLSSAT